MNTATQTSATTREAFGYMTNEEFKERIRAIIGPRPQTDEPRPCVRTPEDRGYYPPAKTESEAA